MELDEEELKATKNREKTNIEEVYIKKMLKIQNMYGDDEEVRHVKEDDLLCELLNELGFRTDSKTI